MITCVSPSCLRGLPPALRLAGLALPFDGVQGHRAAGAAARDCGATPRSSPAPAGLGGPRGPRRAHPPPAGTAADVPAGHARHRAAMAPDADLRRTAAAQRPDRIRDPPQQTTTPTPAASSAHHARTTRPLTSLMNRPGDSPPSVAPSTNTSEPYRKPRATPVAEFWKPTGEVFAD